MRTVFSTCMRYLGTQRARKCTNKCNDVLTAQCHARARTHRHTPSHRREHNGTQAPPLVWQAGVACDAATCHHDTRPVALLPSTSEHHGRHCESRGDECMARAFGNEVICTWVYSSLSKIKSKTPSSAIAAERSKPRLNVTRGASVMSPPT